LSRIKLRTFLVFLESLRKIVFVRNRRCTNVYHLDGLCYVNAFHSWELGCVNMFLGRLLRKIVSLYLRNFVAQISMILNYSVTISVSVLNSAHVHFWTRFALYLVIRFLYLFWIYLKTFLSDMAVARRQSPFRDSGRSLKRPFSSHHNTVVIFLQTSVGFLVENLFVLEPQQAVLGTNHQSHGNWEEYQILQTNKNMYNENWLSEWTTEHIDGSRG